MLSSLLSNYMQQPQSLLGSPQPGSHNARSVVNIPGVGPVTLGGQMGPRQPHQFTWNGQTRTSDPNAAPPTSSGWASQLQEMFGRIIPGMRSSLMNEHGTPEAWRALLPRQANGQANTQMPVSQFQPAGPYGQQAVQLAGLLNNRPYGK